LETKDSKVLIIVSGGVVQSIYSSNPQLQFDILDFDNEELENGYEEEKILESRSEGLVPIY
jgi:hypothetical protein